jgi:hypothetical protein
MPRRVLLAASLLLLAGCGLSERGTRCGIAALAAPGLLLEEFTRPGRTLDSVRVAMPGLLPVRVAAGPAFRGIVGRADTAWVVGVEGAVPDTGLGFGVLLVDPVAGPQGVVLFGGPPIPGAPVLGQVHAGRATVPLIGVQTPAAGFQDQRCPLFPDSLRR